MYDIRQNSIWNRLIAVSIVCSALYAQPSFAQSAATDEPLLTADTDLATAGYFQLRWNSEEPLRLLESTTADFADAHVIYEGSDTGHAVSGRPDGELYFRLESVATGAVLSPPLRVVVAHHPLRRAFTFFGIGAIVFFATAALIFLGSRASGTQAQITPAGNRH